MPLNIQSTDNNGFVRYLNQAAAVRPAKGKREVDANIQNCHARSESLESIKSILKDFRTGWKEPHYYLNKQGNKLVMVFTFDAEDKLVGTLTHSHQVGIPEPERTFD
jgi:DUF438 domain-containing protein